MHGLMHSSIHHATLRSLQESTLTAVNLMYPLFIIPDDDAEEPIESMPGVFRFGITRLIKHLEPLVAKGLKSVLLFGVVPTSMKDARGSFADSTQNPVMRALPRLRDAYTELLIACDVCLCPYTANGHCGLLAAHENRFDNDVSIARIAEVATAYGKAGAHIVAPSDMMDNRIQAIKRALKEAQLDNCVSILSYAAKFASNFYGPFRDAAKSVPAFGDRRFYQLPCGSRGLAMRAVHRDVAEGADMIMVKPGQPYLDVVQQVKQELPHYPLFVYQVSGEYCMLYHAAKNGAFDLNASLMETMMSFRRAGADCIITYFTPQLLDLIKYT